MGLTFIEKIIAAHSAGPVIAPGQIVDLKIDVRVARDFGGANVVKNLLDNGLAVDDPAWTFFTFDCNPTGSDQKYAANQQTCRVFARNRDIKIYDIDAGIGTHIVIDEGLAVPGSTIVSTDSHANILGAVGAFGQGMGDRDVAAVFAHGETWFKVPESVKITLAGQRPPDIYAKDIALNLLNRFGANQLLGYAIEIYGPAVDALTLDERITIASMATEMGGIIILFTPSAEIRRYCEARAGRTLPALAADADAMYAQEFELDLAQFIPMISRPGHPEDAVAAAQVKQIKIDSAFVGSCTNGRLEDMRVVANILRGKKVAPGVVLNIVPATDQLWQACLAEGLIAVFKEAGALVGNAGCAGCAAGQIGQNGPGAVTISTGNRNFAGKQGKGDVYLASPAAVAASAVAGYITTPDDIPAQPVRFMPVESTAAQKSAETAGVLLERPTVVEGRVWLIERDNIDTDMIFHNRYLTITDPAQMGRYTFDNLAGWEDFAQKARPGDIVITGKNFGAGSSRQQAVDCFKSLGVQAVIARSFGAIYERNAINAAFPVLTFDKIDPLELKQGDKIQVDFERGELTNLENGRSATIGKFAGVQMQIYKKGDLLG